MEDIEIDFDKQHEAIHHHAEHSGERWIFTCALISALLAVFAAVSSLYAGHFAGEAMIEEIGAANHWSYYQAKGIKAMLTELKADGITDSGCAVPPALQQKLEGYRRQQEDIKDQANEETAAATRHLAQHEELARAVTAFQIAIGITAIAVLSRRKHFLLFTLALVAAGLWFSAAAFLL